MTTSSLSHTIDTYTYQGRHRSPSENLSRRSKASSLLGKLSSRASHTWHKAGEALHGASAHATAAATVGMHAVAKATRRTTSELSEHKGAVLLSTGIAGAVGSFALAAAESYLAFKGSHINGFMETAASNAVGLTHETAPAPINTTEVLVAGGAAATGLTIILAGVARYAKAS